MSIPSLLPPELADLGLMSHPEGGWYRETHRSAACTVIDFVLLPGELSALHRVHDREEVWVHHRGGPLTLHMVVDGQARSTTLGPDKATAVVPAGAWQGAEPTSDRWVWVSCIVTPPFTFDAFELAPPTAQVPPSVRHLLAGHVP